MTAKLRILVVDDEPLLLRALTRLMLRQGWQVTTAKDGLEALQILAENEFELILSDVRMPRLDGPGLLTALAQRPSPLPPFVFLTGYGDRPDEDLLRLGARAVYGKPVDTPTLLKIAEAHARQPVDQSTATTHADILAPGLTTRR